MKKEETTLTSVLIFANEPDFIRDLHLIENQIIPALNNVKAEFLKLGLGGFTDEYLKDILSNNTGLILDRLAVQIKQDTTSRFLKGAVVNSAQSLLNGLNDTVNEMRKSTIISSNMMLFDFLTVDEYGNIVLTDDANKKLKEHHSIFATTARSVEIYQAHVEAAKAINNFIKLADLNKYSESFAEHFVYDGDGNMVPSVLDYDYL